MRTLLKLLTLLASFVTPAMAQNSSLYHDAGPPVSAAAASPDVSVAPRGLQPVPTTVAPPRGGAGIDPDRPPIYLSGASWTHQPMPPMRVFRKNDIVTIRVDEITRTMAQGLADIRKRSIYETILTDWVRLTDFRLQPDPQENGDPSVGAEANINSRAQSAIETRESMTFNIAAKIVDIRPNGMIVLEARKSIRINDNLFETSLIGNCRAEDIGPDNVVLSKDMTDLEIGKQDQGHLRDGYKRGWLARWIDRLGPF